MGNGKCSPFSASDSLDNSKPDKRLVSYNTLPELLEKKANQ